MKKLIPVSLALYVLFSFCACGNGSNIDRKAAQATPQAQESSAEDISTTEEFDDKITVRIGDKSFSAKLYDNETALDFADMLPLTLDMNELNGNEKYYYLKHSLPTDSSNAGKINNGDIMLYGNNCLVLFYDSFSTQYSYTKIGRIENPTELADAVGKDNITIIFEK